MEEANKHKVMEDKHRLRMERASVEENTMKGKIAQLKAFLMNKECEKAQPHIDHATLIKSVIQGMLFQGLMLTMLMFFPHMPLDVVMWADY